MGLSRRNSLREEIAKSSAWKMVGPDPSWNEWSMWLDRLVKIVKPAPANVFFTDPSV